MNLEGYNLNDYNNYGLYENIELLNIENKNIENCLDERQEIQTRMKNKKVSCNLDDEMSEYLLNQNKIFKLKLENPIEDKCKKRQSKINDLNNYSSSNSKTNIYKNKNNKQLNSRSIKTIPYRNYKNYDFNPELESIMISGLYNDNNKSNNNISEIKRKKYPLNKNIKDNHKRKNNIIDLDRFQLSSRQLKGNDYYEKYYKNKLKSLNNII